MINEKADAPTSAPEVKPGMKNPIIHPKLLPTELTNDDVLFGLLIGNATWLIANGIPIPKGAK